MNTRPHPYANKLFRLSIFFILSCLITSQAQKSFLPRVQTAISTESNVSVIPTREIALLPSTKYRLPVVAVKPQSLPELDIAEMEKKSANQVGFERPVAIDVRTRSKGFRNGDGSEILIFSIRSPGALGLRLHITAFDIPDTDEVYIYGLGLDSEVQGPYRGKGPWEDSSFWSATVKGDTAIIEYYSKGRPRDFGISEVAHLIEDPRATLPPNVLSCEIDASCYTNLEKNAVGRIVFQNGGSFVCSGTLLNDRNSTFIPYFLTANHCVSSQSVAQTVETYWFYQTTSCNSGVLKSGIVHAILGADLLVTKQSYDSTLLRIKGQAPAGAAFSGWDANAKSIDTLTFGFHHPGGGTPPSTLSFLRRSDGKIASTSSSCSASGLIGGYLVNWTSGLTEGGSSGSGLWFSSQGNSYLVGVLSCGPATPDCNFNGNSLGLYGKFSEFFPLIQSYIYPLAIGDGAPNPQLFIDAANRNNLSQYVNLPPINTVHRWDCSTCDPNNSSWGKGLIQDFNGNDGFSHDALMVADTNTNFVSLIYGGMWEKFIQLGDLNYNSSNNRMIGYPIADRNCSDFNAQCFTDAQLVSPFGTSYHYQRFQGGALVLHKSGTRLNQTFEVHGAIRTRWQALGGPSSGGYGLPISDEYASAAKRRSDFEGGSICYNPATNQTEDGCSSSTTRMLVVASANPNSNVNVTVTPNDINSSGNGTTQFTRTYNNNANVNLTAPASAGANSFQKWQRDGVDWSTSQATSLTMDSNHTMTAVYSTAPARRTRWDYSGDGRADLGIWRGVNGTWYVINSLNSSVLTQQWGNQSLGDVPVAGDFDGDGRFDYAIWRAQNGTWYIIKSSTGTGQTQQWGNPSLGDVPAPADFDGDGKTDIAIWRASSGTWYIINSSNNSVTQRQWGVQSEGDRPVAGDYDGDARADIAIWRASTGTWYIINSSNGIIQTRQWGNQSLGDVPVIGDFDGDTRIDISVWRATNGTWYMIFSSDGVARQQQWGVQSQQDKPVPADFDGDGKTDIVIWRGVNGVWYIIQSSNGSIQTQQWGNQSLGDVPTPAF